MYTRSRFLAHAIYKIYNGNYIKYFNYINDKKQIFFTKLSFENYEENNIINKNIENDNM